jgi:HK97 gp10 family phage protein
MAADFDIKLTGAKDILDRLSTLPDKLQKKGAVRAARKAMRVALNDARARARLLDDPKTGESIFRNLAIQNSPRQGRRVGGVVMRLGVRGGAQQYASTKENVRKGRAGKTYKTAGSKGNPGGDTWYWRFLELGTRRTHAHEFLQPALRDNAAAVEGLVAQYLDEEIALLTPK